MTNTLPTIDIKGKSYVMVKDRILAFNETYTNGSIQTELVSAPEATTIIVKAIVTPDVKNPTRVFVDYSQAVIGEGYINKTAALENASTSAVGRALAYMGIGVIESIASADEVHKAMTAPSADYTREPFDPEGVGTIKAISGVNWKKCAKHGKAYNADKFSQCYFCATESETKPADAAETTTSSEGKDPIDAF